MRRFVVLVVSVVAVLSMAGAWLPAVASADTPTSSTTTAGSTTTSTTAPADSPSAADSSVGSTSTDPTTTASTSTSSGFVAGKSSEIVGDRTADSSTYKNPDGSYTAMVSAFPTHYKDSSGAWQNISMSVHADSSGGGLVSGANSSSAHFAKLGQGGGVGVSEPAGSVTFVPQGAAAVAPAADPSDSSEAVYSDVWPGVNLDYQMQPFGFEEDIVLSASSDPATYTFNTPGVSWQSGPGGGLVPVGALNGSAEVPAPVVYDAAGHQRQDASATLSSSGDAITVSVAPTWLAGLPASAFPLTIDPSYDWTGSTPDDWCYESTGTVQSPCDVQLGNSRSVINGTTEDTMWRTLLHFWYTPVVGAKVYGAKLVLSGREAGTANNYPDQVWEAPPGSSGFNNSAYTEIGSFTSPSPGCVQGGTGVSGCSTTLAGLATYYATAAASGSNGYMVQLHGDGLDGTYTYQEYKNVSLELNYDTAPNTPAVGESASSSHTGIQLRASASDPDGGNVTYHFGVWTGTGRTGTEVASGTSATVASGTAGVLNLTPTGVYSWNTPYYWAAYATDGTLNSAWTSGTNTFKFTNSPPPSPALDTPGSSTTAVVSTADPTLTVSAATDPDGDAVKYQFQVATGSTGQTGIVATSAWQTATTWTLPAGSTLQNGVYYWTARAEDSYNAASGWTAPKQFTVSITGPAWVGAVSGDTTVNGSPTLQVVTASTVTAATFQLLENGTWQTLGAATAGTGDTWSYPWDSTSVSDGADLLRVALVYSGTTTTTYSGPLVWVENHGPSLADETTGGSNPAEPDVTNPASKLADSGTDAAVDDTTGELDVAHQDLGFDGGNGIALALSRSYSSTDAAVSGSFGYGWRDSYDMTVSSDPASIAALPVEDVTWPDGAVERYAEDASGAWVSPSQGNDTLTSPTGGGWQLADPSGDTYTFSAAGRLTTIADADGYETLLSYNTSGQLVSVTSYMTANSTTGTDRTISLVWGGCGAGQCITGATDSAGETVSYGYDSAGNLISVVDVAGKTTGYAYNGSHQITGITDALNNTTTVSYSSDSRVDSVTDPLGDQTQWSGSLDGSGAGSITITDPLERETQDVFSTGEMTAQTVAAGTSAAATTSWTYDPTSDGVATTTTPDDQACPTGCQTATSYTTAANTSGGVADDVATQTDANGAQSTYTYGTDNKATVATTAAGTSVAETTTTTYSATDGDLQTAAVPIVESTGGTDEATEALTYADQPGDPTKADVTDATSDNSTSTTYTYDAYGNKVSSTDQDGDETTYGYNNLGQKTCEGTPTAAAAGITCPAPVAGTTTYAYDAYGNVIDTVDADGNTTTASYDPNGNELTSTDGDGQTTTNTYDADGNLIKTVGPDGATTTYKYDADGQKISETDPNRNTTAYTYDQRGNMATEVDPGNQTTTYSYDLDNNKLTEVDPDNNTTTWTYDPDGHELTETQGYGTPDAETVTWSYDANGNQVSYKDAANDLTTYVYNGLNQLISQTVGAGTSQAEATAWTYNANGDKATMVDPNGVTVTWSYDDGDRLTGIGYSDTTAPVTYTYTPDGQIATMADVSGTTNYTYDADDQLTKYLNGADKTVTYGYDPAGNVTSIGYPNGKTVTETYNPAEQLKSVTDWDGNTTSFGYDPDGNQTSTEYPNRITDTRSYNSADQLTGIADTNSGGAKVLSFAYGVDPAGLTTSETDTGTPGPATTNYTYNALEQLTGAGSNSYSYDSANNLTTDPGGDSQAFNGDGQLCWTASSATTSTGCLRPPDGATSYAYDSDGNLATVTPASGATMGYTWNAADQLIGYNGTNQASYAYDANGFLQSETTPAGTAGLTWDTQASLPETLADGTNFYIYGTGTGPVEQINATTGTVSYLLTDQLGSTRAITDQNGNVTGTITYDPWGNTTATTGTINTPYQYAGAYLDTTSGLYYMRARWYSPVEGEFISIDPDLTATDTTYDYDNDNPVDGNDPTGAVRVTYLHPFVPVHLKFAAANVSLEWDPVRGLVGGTIQLSWLFQFITSGRIDETGVIWSWNGRMMPATAPHYGVKPGYVLHFSLTGRFGLHGAHIEFLDEIGGRSWLDFTYKVLVAGNLKLV